MAWPPRLLEIRAIKIGGHFIKVMDADGPTKLRATEIASVSESVRSQPMRAGT